jgi:uncharacterized protein
MPRILLFVFLAFLVWLVIRWLGGLRKTGTPASDAHRSAGADARQEIETMRQCAWCGAHVPATDAVALPDGRVYCGIAHRDAARDTTASREPQGRE